MMAARAVKVLRESLSQNLEDVKEVLDQFEATHSESEREQSTEYGVLVECQFGLEEVIDKIDINITCKTPQSAESFLPRFHQNRKRHDLPTPHQPLKSYESDRTLQVRPEYRQHPSKPGVGNGDAQSSPSQETIAKSLNPMTKDSLSQIARENI